MASCRAAGRPVSLPPAWRRPPCSQRVFHPGSWLPLRSLSNPAWPLRLSWRQRPAPASPRSIVPPGHRQVWLPPRVKSRWIWPSRSLRVGLSNFGLGRGRVWFGFRLRFGDCGRSGLDDDNRVDHRVGWFAFRGGGRLDRRRLARLFVASAGSFLRRLGRGFPRAGVCDLLATAAGEQDPSHDDNRHEQQAAAHCAANQQGGWKRAAGFRCGCRLFSARCLRPFGRFAPCGLRGLGGRRRLLSGCRTGLLPALAGCNFECLGRCGDLNWRILPGQFDFDRGTRRGRRGSLVLRRRGAARCRRGRRRGPGCRRFRLGF